VLLPILVNLAWKLAEKRAENDEDTFIRAHPLALFGQTVNGYKNQSTEREKKVIFLRFFGP
jgi:hypothetical protein